MNREDDVVSPLGAARSILKRTISANCHKPGQPWPAPQCAQFWVATWALEALPEVEVVASTPIMAAALAVPVLLEEMAQRRRADDVSTRNLALAIVGEFETGQHGAPEPDVKAELWLSPRELAEFILARGGVALPPATEPEPG